MENKELVAVTTKHVDNTNNLENKEKGERPYIMCMVVRPNQPPISSTQDIEGLKIELLPNGDLDPDSVTNFIMEANMVALEDKRTHVMTVRLRNNMIISESVSSLTREGVDENAARQVLIQRVFSKVHDYMMFLVATATVSDNKILADYNACGQIPVDVQAALGVESVTAAVADKK